MAQTVRLSTRRALLTAGAAGMMATGLLSGDAAAQSAAGQSGGVDLSQVLSVTSQFVLFVRQAEEKLHTHKLAHGEELEPLLEKSGVKIPEWLRGSGIVYQRAEEMAKPGEGGLVIVTPGDPRIVELRLFCVCFKRWNVCVCLECGWIWCRIVIVGRF